MLVSSTVLGDIKCNFSPSVIGPHLCRVQVRDPAFNSVLRMSGRCQLLPTSKAPAAFLMIVCGRHFEEMCILGAASCDLTHDFAWPGCVLG